MRTQRRPRRLPRRSSEVPEPVATPPADGLEERVERLERELGSLREGIEALRRELGA